MTIIGHDISNIMTSSSLDMTSSAAGGKPALHYQFPTLPIAGIANFNSLPIQFNNSIASIANSIPGIRRA
jgi:hypothetical protein